MVSYFFFLAGAFFAAGFLAAIFGFAAALAGAFLAAFTALAIVAPFRWLNARRKYARIGNETQDPPCRETFRTAPHE
ncbi:MAG: hypothetical protein AB7M12_00650 [Hyphomonadaceae bacterium]